MLIIGSQGTAKAITHSGRRQGTYAPSLKLAGFLKAGLTEGTSLVLSGTSASKGNADFAPANMALKGECHGISSCF